MRQAGGRETVVVQRHVLAALPAMRATAAEYNVFLSMGFVVVVVFPKYGTSKLGFWLGCAVYNAYPSLNPAKRKAKLRFRAAVHS